MAKKHCHDKFLIFFVCFVFCFLGIEDEDKKIQETGQT